MKFSDAGFKFSESALEKIQEFAALANQSFSDFSEAVAAASAMNKYAFRVESFDMSRLNLTAEEFWYHRNAFNPGGGKLPRSVARIAKSRAANRRWIRREDGSRRFTLQS